MGLLQFGEMAAHMNNLAQEIERVLTLTGGPRYVAILDLFNDRGAEILEACRNLELGNKLVAILSYYCGERGDPEGAVETLNRIIMERAAERGSK